VLDDHDMTLPVRTLNLLVEAVINEIRGFGPLEVLLADDSDLGDHGQWSAPGDPGA
jgi:Flp pilus assembly CpaF family ATPase